MAHQHSQDRFQMQMRSTEDFVGKDNPVRFIDALVAQLELARLGFVVSAVKIERYFWNCIFMVTSMPVSYNEQGFMQIGN